MDDIRTCMHARSHAASVMRTSGKYTHAYLYAYIYLDIGIYMYTICILYTVVYIAMHI